MTEDHSALPDTITLDRAFRAAYYMTQQYIALESKPDAGRVLYMQYLHSDPARWNDWLAAVHQGLTDDGTADPDAKPPARA